MRMLVVAVAAFVSACAMAVMPSSPVATPGGVRFVLMRADATSVALAGSFNGWSTTSHPLARSKTSKTSKTTKPGGLWSIVVPLPPGEHAFMYVVNGTEWVSPPMAEDYVDDGFGARNGVVVVR